MGIWSLSDGWMFSAWSDLRQDFRTLRLDHMSNLIITGDRFDNDEDRGRAFVERESGAAPN